LNDSPVLLGAPAAYDGTTPGPLVGGLDEVRFYNVALTDAQIAALW
jgi:hypothetical protein